MIFDPEFILLPCIEVAHENESKGLPRLAAELLWTHCAGVWLDRSELRPAEPKDWAQQVTLPGKLRELRQLERFEKDPVERVLRIAAPESVRRQIHQAIDSAGLDMTHVTERKGRPYTLVCTKTRASFRRALIRYRSDLALMRRLLALRPACPRLRDRLQRAAQLKDD